MLCVRCSQELPPRADRCLRCFSLNPQNRPAARAPSPRAAPAAPPAPPPPAAAPFDLEAEPRPLEFSLASDPPRLLPLSLSFQSDPLPVPAGWRDQHQAPPAPTEPPEPAWTLGVAEVAQAEGTASIGCAPISAAPAATAPCLSGSLSPPALAQRSSLARALLFAWLIDLALLLSCAALHVALAALVIGPARLAPALSGSLDYWLDLLLFGHRLPALWALLGACLSLAYSWLFASLGGRTPGMALAHLRLVREDGGTLSPPAALLRAACSLPSAALGLFGFALALFDPRCQTLHDKLARTLVVPD